MSAPAAARRLHLDVGPPLSEIPQWHPSTFSKIGTCFGNAIQKLWVMLETIIEPVVFRGESNQDPGWSAVAGDHDLVVHGQPEVFG